MGAINYGNNNIINLGVNTFDYTEKMQKEIEQMGLENEVILEEYIYEGLCILYSDCERIIDNLNLEFYQLSLKSGYYEGFYLDIENKVCYYENFKEKQLAQKELTQIKKALKQMILKCELVCYSPNWCTSYENKDNTLKMLNEAIKKERELIKDTLTDNNISIELWVKGIFTKTNLKNYKLSVDNV